MDLETIEIKLENNCYLDLDQFLVDCKLIFANCRTYNPEGSNYVKNANRVFPSYSFLSWWGSVALLIAFPVFSIILVGKVSQGEFFFFFGKQSAILTALICFSRVGIQFFYLVGETHHTCCFFLGSS